MRECECGSFVGLQCQLQEKTCTAGILVQGENVTLEGGLHSHPSRLDRDGESDWRRWMQLVAAAPGTVIALLRESWGHSWFIEKIPFVWGNWL